MGTGYMVYCGPAAEEGGVVEAYLEARERLLGYPKVPPPLRIAAREQVEHPQSQLTDAPVGLVKSRAGAGRLLGAMRRVFPGRTWAVAQYTFPGAEENPPGPRLRRPRPASAGALAAPAD